MLAKHLKSGVHVAVIAVFCSFASSVVASAAVCVSLLTDSELTGVLLEDRALRTEFSNNLRARGTDTPSLTFLREIESDHPDGPLYLYSLQDPSRPNSTFGFDHNNPHGAHQFTSLVVGPRVARLLGVSESAGGREVILPSPRRINAAIQRLNRYLPPEQQIHWTFYSDLGKTNGQTYLDQIIEVMGLPISAEVIIHDINFHLGSIAMPNLISNFLQARVRSVRDLTQYLRKRLNQDAIDRPDSTPPQWLIEAIIKDVISAEVTRFDEINGNFTFETGRDNLNYWFNKYFAGSRSLSPPANLVRESASNFVYSQSQSPVLNLWLTALLENYAATHVDPVMPALSLQELQAEVLTRRLALEEAAIAVENEQP